MIPLAGISGAYTERTKGSVSLEFHSTVDNSASCVLQLLILLQLIFKIPSFDLLRASKAHLRNLQLADPNFGKTETIQVIIGADSYDQIIKLELIKSDSSPIAQLIFGWMISGPIALDIHSLHCGIYHYQIDYNLQDLLTHFWELEETPKSNSVTLSSDDANCERQFSSTCSRDQIGQYIVRLPLKSPTALLGDSTSIVVRCL